MYNIIGVFLFTLFLTAETRYSLPLESETSQDVPINTAENKISYKLSEVVKPDSYCIELTVHLDENNDKNFTFDGSVIILLNVKKATKNITLHSQDLNIKEMDMVMKYPFSKSIEVEYTNETTTDFLTITQKTQNDFQKGHYILSITYKGILIENFPGFYRNHYINDNGEKVWFAATQFEPIFARRAIPCFDEPAYKATFEMKITHNKKFKALFNTKSVAITDNKDGTMTTKFEKTPLMSTYLLAFVISDFASIQNVAKNLTVYARPNAIQFGNLAIKKGEEILKKLEAFTNIPFETGIGKMDQIALSQFTPMENWGLVTYSEEKLLFNEKNSTAAQKQHIIEVIAHEFAHQWFGNLVSPKWWKYLWLNEGFANFLQTYITDQVESTWRCVEQSVVNSIQTTMFDEDSDWTHPIHRDVERPEEIYDMFSSIAYQKGAAVIRMMQHYLTDEIFRKGLQQYLIDFKYKAAESDDLFNSIQKVIDEEKRNIQIKAFMGAWVNKKGYPIVTVTRDYQKNNMILKQERFFTYNASAEERKDNLWHIPISYATERNPDFKNTSAHILFNKAKETVPVDDAEKEHWIILNKQQTGFYRVNYDEKNWKLIINYLNSPNRERIHPLNRAQLINDALAFVKEEIIGLHILLQLTAHLKYETDYIAWTPAFKVFSYLKSKLINTEYYPVFKKYVLTATAALIESVGLEASEKDDHIKKLTRIPAIDLACSLGHNECISKMQGKLFAWLKDEKKTIIPEDLKEATFCYGLQNASFTLWEDVLNKSKSHADLNEKQVMIQALGCTNQKTILEHYLYDTLANNETDKYIVDVIQNILSKSEVGIDAVLDFVVPNIFTLQATIGSKFRLTELLSSVGAKIKTKEQLEKFRTMENLNDLIPHDLIADAVQFAERNLKWLQKYNETLAGEFIQRPCASL